MPEGEPSVVVRTLECGMTLCVEPMPGVRTVAVNWLLPAGHATDPVNDMGCSAMLAELIQRGAGQLDSKQFSDALDRVGEQRAVSSGASHIVFSGLSLGDRLFSSLELVASMIRDPRMPEDALPAVQSLALQNLESLNDDPQHLVGLRLRHRHMPEPFNRTGFGEAGAIKAAMIEPLRDAWHARARPVGSIFAAAGAVDADELARELDRLLKGWRGTGLSPEPASTRIGGSRHDIDESNQTHVAMAFDAPTEGDPDAVTARLATDVLGSGTSSRLFVEVRERRGLCYSVAAGYAGGLHRGMVTVYAGSTPERAQATLDCILDITTKFEQGVTKDELRRAKTGLECRLIMAGESTTSRASGIAGDFHRLGRCRSLREIAAEVSSHSLERVNDFIARRMGAQWRSTMTLCSIGRQALDVKGAISSGPSEVIASRRGATCEAVV